MPDIVDSQIERRRAGEWHLDKTVSVTHIGSTAAAIAAIVVIGSQFNTRLTLVEQAVVVQHGTEERQDRDAAESRRVVGDNISKINDKLDRLIEARMK